MKFAVIALVAAILCFGAKPKKPAKTVDTDEQYACRGDVGYHKCSCVAHTARVVAEYISSCRQKSRTAKELEACMRTPPSHCDVVKNVDEKEMRNTCTRSCTKARCRCSDGPACFLPQIYN